MIVEFLFWRKYKGFIFRHKKKIRKKKPTMGFRRYIQIEIKLFNQQTDQKKKNYVPTGGFRRVG